MKALRASPSGALEWIDANASFPNFAANLSAKALLAMG